MNNHPRLVRIESARAAARCGARAGNDKER